MPLLHQLEEFILALLKPRKDKDNGTTGASGVEGPKNTETGVDGYGPVSWSKPQLLKTGIFMRIQMRLFVKAQNGMPTLLSLKMRLILEKRKFDPCVFLRAFWVGSLGGKQKIQKSKKKNWGGENGSLLYDSKELWLAAPVNVGGKLSTYPSVLGLQIMLCRDKGQAVCFRARDRKPASMHTYIYIGASARVTCCWATGVTMSKRMSRKMSNAFLRRLHRQRIGHKCNHKRGRSPWLGILA